MTKRECHQGMEGIAEKGFDFKKIYENIIKFIVGCCKIDSKMSYNRILSLKLTFGGKLQR